MNTLLWWVSTQEDVAARSSIHYLATANRNLKAWKYLPKSGHSQLQHYQLPSATIHKYNLRPIRSASAREKQLPFIVLLSGGREASCMGHRSEIMISGDNFNQQAC